MTAACPTSWLDTSRPPWPYTLEDWQRMPWAARARVVDRMRPAPVDDTSPAWRLEALANRAHLDALAPAGSGHVRHPRPHRRTSVHTLSPDPPTPAGDEAA